MDVQADIREIFSHLRALLRSYQELGLDPPRLSGHVFDGPATREARATLAGEAGSEERKGSSPRGDRAALLRDLRRRIGDCQGCKLCKNRNRLVFGEGSPEARLVFVGEGPGHEEDRAGRPFVGESGKLLTRIIENGMGLTRQDVYICNVVKCHPPRNRDPEPDEIAACLPFLKEQLRIIRPEVICTLGRVAVQALLGKQFRITAERGQWRTYQGIPLMPTFHPAYLLHHVSAKREVWEDVKEIMRRLGLEVKTRG